MTKEEFQSWARQTIDWAGKACQNGESKQERIDAVASFDRHAATLLKMWVASGNALADYLKTRIDNH